MYNRTDFRSSNRIFTQRWLVALRGRTKGTRLLLLLHTLGERERTKRMNDARRSSSLAVVVVRSMTHAHIIYYGPRTRDDDTVRKVQYGRTSINPDRHWRSSNRRRSPVSTILDDVCAYSGARRSRFERPRRSWEEKTCAYAFIPTDERRESRRTITVVGGSIDSKYIRANDNAVELSWADCTVCNRRSETE